MDNGIKSPTTNSTLWSCQQKAARPLPARRNIYSTTLANDSVVNNIIESVPSFMIVTQVQLYRSYKVDLTWKRAVHSCNRCPKAQLNSVSLISQYSNLDSQNRFCPAGVHMGHCTPVSEVLHNHTIHRQSISNGLFDLSTNRPKGRDEKTASIYSEDVPNDSMYPLAPSKLPHPQLSYCQQPTEATQITSSSSHGEAKKVKEIVKDYVRRASSPPLVKAEIDIEDNLYSNQNRIEDSYELKSTDPRKSNIKEENKTNNFVTNSESSNVNADKTTAHGLDTKVLITTPRKSKLDSDMLSSVNSPPSTPRQENDRNNNGNTSIFTKTDPIEISHEENHSLNVIDQSSSSLHDAKVVEDGPLERKIPSQIVSPSIKSSSPSIVDDPTVKSRTSVQNKLLDASTTDEAEEKAPSIKDNPPEVAMKPKVTKEQPKIIQRVKSPPKAEPQKSASYDTVPRFHLPSFTSSLSETEINKEISRISQLIKDNKDIKTTDTEQITIPYENFNVVTTALNVSLYWKRPIYLNCGGNSETDEATSLDKILEYWRKVLSNSSDEASRFIHVLTNGKSKYLEFEHFEPVIYDIIYTHPGLKFLKSAPDFHHKYVSTVIARIFFCVNSSWSGRISLVELRKSNLLAELQHVADETDINVVTNYFSYEHFYVIYCRFWELDTDHDLIINKEDLKRHNNNSISERMIDRIFSGSVTKGKSFKEGIMTYTEFVWFLIAEEDKRHPRSIEYWFRCMDLDGDGVLSMYELEYFYVEQIQRMEEFGAETINFQDTLCQCLDMVKPQLGDKILLSDLKKCKLCHIFFDIFFNVQKVIRYDTRDPFTNLRDIQEGLHEVSDWDRYADEAYDLLTAIECSTDGNINYEDDEDELDPGDLKGDKADLDSPGNEE